MLGTTETARGVLYAKSGFPWVRLEGGTTITVNHKGRIEHRREVPWSERWTKVEPAVPSTTDAAGEDRAPAEADATTPASTPAASRTTQELSLIHI